ncbi:MAG: hypothetical protein LBH00_01055 [Planctomycetaceae bacterium]|jgi:hypothetical protein|nr:hypothetical protein [Planctomycetaceae bacterium]
MLKIYLLTILPATGFLLCGMPVFGDFGDCLWGGRNEETAYSANYLSGSGRTTLPPPVSPSMNLGAPPSGIAVQATPNTQGTTVPQANIPTITVPTGPVGSVGRPATEGTAPQTPLPQAPPGTEIVYVLPPPQAPEAVCLDGVRSIPAAETKVVPPDTPGAIPVALKTVMVRRPITQLHWTYAPIVHREEQLVNVVNPRTGKVVRSFCRTEETAATSLPWLHLREVVTYETVEAKIGTPVSLVPAAAAAANTSVLPGNAAPSGSTYQSNYPGEPVIGTIVLP